MKNIITGLDIGTSKICAAIGGLSDDGAPEIRGIGVSDAKGINKGFVSSLDKLVDSISKAVKAAEDKSGLKAYNVITNISGGSVAGNLCEGAVPLSRRGREITKRDIEKAFEATKQISTSLDKDFLHAVPQEYMVDDNDGVENPHGLFGTKLKAKLYVITALATHIQNIKRAVNYSGYEISEIIPTVVASLAGILSAEEKKDGVIVIDVGGGITEMAIINNGILRFFDSVNVGGMDLTAHISANLKVPFRSAEDIKRKYGNISREDSRKVQRAIFDVEGRHVTIETDQINSLIKERFEEIFYILKERLSGSDHFSPSMPLVITGGGALLNGALESFEEYFKMPVSLGRAKEIKGDPSISANPTYSAAISLAKYGIAKCNPSSSTFRPKGFLVDSYLRIKDILNDYF